MFSAERLAATRSGEYIVLFSHKTYREPALGKTLFKCEFHREVSNPESLVVEHSVVLLVKAAVVGNTRVSRAYKVKLFAVLRLDSVTVARPAVDCGKSFSLSGNTCKSNVYFFNRSGRDKPHIIGGEFRDDCVCLANERGGVCSVDFCQSVGGNSLCYGVGFFNELSVRSGDSRLHFFGRSK